jgi:hypothetical protein
VNRIHEIITGEISRPRVFFVFPSGVAADLWARKAGEFAGVRSLALNRFMAWDRFKERAILAEAPGKRPVSSVIRKLFAEKLVKENGAEKFLQALIPPEHAESGGVFAASIAALLPSLGYWEKRVQRAADYDADYEDRDLARVKTAYAAFLEDCGLFEPSWQELGIRDTDNKYYIFFPEAIEDFGEYAELLENSGAFHLVHPGEDGEAPALDWYAELRGEIRALVLEIRRLHETEGIPYGDMAVSAPRLEDMAPYLGREFALYDIPLRMGAGKPLSAYGAGRLFTLIQNCVTGDFSYASLKALLLDFHLPWARPDLNMELLEFGVRNNCLASYQEKGKTVDIWEAAFSIASREELLRQYYGGLKKELSAIVRAKSFLDIRRHYFAFRNASLDMSQCGPESDRVLARCVEELSALIRLEADYPRLVPESPFGFFLSLLGETKYVPNQNEEGVNLFPYRVAAAAPFRCHFVLNASQGAASVVYRPLDFLRQDKRRQIGLDDTDVSAVFFRLYQVPVLAGLPGHHYYSAAEETLSGTEIPHSFFTAPGTGGASGFRRDRAPPPGDPFHREKAWWAETCHGKEVPAEGVLAAGNGEFPSRLFPIQRKGFQNWRALLGEGRGRRFSLLAEQFPPAWPALPLVRDEIRRTQWSPAPGDSGENAAPVYLRVSATSLNSFFRCPALWFFERILKLGDYSLEAELMDDMALGNLYHEILKNLFEKIRRQDTYFLPEHLGDYGSWAEELTREAAREFRAFQGPLAVPLLSAQAGAIARRIARLLETEAAYFPRYAVAGLEQRFSAIRQADAVPVLLVGTLDRISVSEDDEPVIMDYKTNKMPTKAESAVKSGEGISNYQMAMYTCLYEETCQVPVGGAYFISIRQNEINAVIGKPRGKRGFDREEFQPALDALEADIRRFAGAMETAEFSPRPIRRETCAGCVYRTICRTTYYLNAEGGNPGDRARGEEFRGR